MKIKDYFINNKKEITALSKLKLPLKKSTEKLLLSKPTTKDIEYYSLIQLWRGKIIERVFAVRLKRKLKPEYQEVIRRIEGNGLIITRNMYYGNLCGYRTVWDETRPSPYHFNKETAYNVWFVDYIQYYNVWIKEYLFTMDDIAAIDSSLKYCAWRKQPIIDWVTIYRKHPEIEMISKVGLDRLLYNTKVLEMLKDKSFKKYLYWCGGDDNTIGKDILYGYRHSLSMQELYKKREIDRIIKVIIEAYPTIPKEPLYKYLNKYYETNNRHMNSSSYIDMIRAEEYLHLDLSLEKNIFPHDFQYWHDYYTKQYQAALNKDTDILIEEQAVKYKKLAKEVEGLKLLIPTKTSEFISEGKALKHCVGRMGYNTKMARGETLILFVRKQEEIDKPFITMEYDPKQKKIKQLYGYKDSVPEESIKDIIYNKWLPKVKRLKFA